jgi:hypothetical protein
LPPKADAFAAIPLNLRGRYAMAAILRRRRFVGYPTFDAVRMELPPKTGI